MKKALALVALLLTGGCQMMRYDTDDVPPPPPSTAGPTTVPSVDTAEPFTFGGAAHDLFVGLPTRLYELFTDNTPKDAALQMETAKTADSRRRGLTALADRSFGRAAPYTDRYAQIARFDDDASVRAAAVRALNRSRDGSAAAEAVYLEGLKDPSAAIRLESAKALANVPSTGATTQLLTVLNDTAQPADVRIAAADALRHYRSLEVARALINLLSDRDFGLAWQARQSLRTMTGTDKFYDQAGWLAYLSGPESSLS